jgi:hypothetical protein
MDAQFMLTEKVKNRTRFNFNLYSIYPNIFLFINVFQSFQSETYMKIGTAKDF